MQRLRIFFVLTLVAAGFFCLPLRTDAVETRAPQVRTFELRATGKTLHKRHKVFYAYNKALEDGGTIAVGNLDGKGSDEIVVGAGPGQKPFVRIFTGNGKLIREFMAYDSGMDKGVNVALGDTNGDGRDEIITGTGFGARPHVRRFSSSGKPIAGFFPFSKNARSGVHVAVGNVRGDAKEDIIVASGPGLKPRVKVYSGRGKFMKYTLAPFGANDQGGVSVAAVNVDGGVRDEIVAAIHTFGEPRVKVYRTNDKKQILGNFFAYSKNFRGGVNVTGADTDKDGVEEVITSTRQGGAPHIRVFEGHGELVYSGFYAYEKSFRGGVAIAAGNIDHDSKPELVTIPQKRRAEGRLDLPKYIDIDLSEQKLRAYRNGILEKEFPISSGVARFPTPKGTFPIRKKILKKDYEWSYGINHPDNYDIKDVPYNLQFLPTYYLHNAYWHNNFGTPMSHGCININLENSKWIYEWADVGDPVVIHD